MSRRNLCDTMRHRKHYHRQYCIYESASLIPSFSHFNVHPRANEANLFCLQLLGLLTVGLMSLGGLRFVRWQWWHWHTALGPLPFELGHFTWGHNLVLGQFFIHKHTALCMLYFCNLLWNCQGRLTKNIDMAQNSELGIDYWQIMANGGMFLKGLDCGVPAGIPQHVSLNPLPILDLMHWRHKGSHLHNNDASLVSRSAHVLCWQCALALSLSLRGPGRASPAVWLAGFAPLAACLAMTHVAVFCLTPNAAGCPSVTSYAYGLLVI